MVDITKPIYGDIWANAGETLNPGATKIATGWIQEMMPYQYENFLQNRTDIAISYLLQKGIPEWSAEQEYTANKSVVTYGSQLYMATATTTNVLPTVTASWKKLSVSFGANGAIPVSFGGTGATTAVDARTNLGIGSAATANLPAGNGMLVKLTDNTLVARSVAGTAGYITVTNGDGVAGNLTINVGANVAKTDTDAAWTTTSSIRLPSGSTAQRGTGAPGRIRFNLETGIYEGYDNVGWNPVGGVGTLDVQNFQGDGVRTAFTLSSTPRAENNTQVYFNGVYQQKNTYNLVGNDLVFDEAPTSDTSIEVVNVSSVPVGTTTAAQTSIVDSGNYYNSSNVEGALQYVGETLSNAVLTFPNYASASAASATLPDGQYIEAPDAQEKLSRYIVQSGALVFQRLTEDAARANYMPAGVGAVATNVQSKLRETVSVKDFGAVGDGITDDTAAFIAALAASLNVYAPAGTYVLSAIDLNRNGHTLHTDGFATIFQQKSDSGVGVRMLNVKASNIIIESCTVKGNISTDTDEQNHSIYIQANNTVGSIDNIFIADVIGVDVRGDVVYAGRATGTASTLTNIRIGNIVVSNVYRNGVSLVSCDGVQIKSVTGSAIGFCHVDVEPNVGSGTATNIKIDYIKGRVLGLNSPSASDYIDNVSVGMLDLSPSNSSQSTPSYAAGATVADGLLLRNIKRVSIDVARISGYNRCAAFVTYNAGELGCQSLKIASAWISNCSITDTVYNSYIQAIAITTNSIEIGYLNVSISGSNKRFIDAMMGGYIRNINADVQSSAALIRNSNDFIIENINQSGAGGFMLHSCNRGIVKGGNFTGDRLATSSTKCTFENLTATAAVFLFSSGQEDHVIISSTLNSSYYDYGNASTNAATNYLRPQRFGSYRLWVSSDGKLRIKSGAPASDTDGTVVGTQT